MLSDSKLLFQTLLTNFHDAVCRYHMSELSKMTTGRKFTDSWWRHQMETCSAVLSFCAGNSPVTGEFPTQRPVTRSFDVFFDLCLNKRLSKQSRGWWFKTLSCSLWRHCKADTRFTSQREMRYDWLIKTRQLLNSIISNNIIWFFYRIILRYLYFHIHSMAHDEGCLCLPLPQTRV